MSASFETVVEFADSVLLILGGMTTIVCALMTVIMVGAAAFVHIPHGIFLANGGWELVGVIMVGLFVVASTGPGRFSLDQVVRVMQEKHRRELVLATS